jgi:gliding motility-associated-like protein
VSLITTSNAGCIDTISQLVNIPVPITYQLVSTIDSCSGECLFQISPSISSMNSVWDFGDGIVLQNPNFSHTYQQAGNYNVTIVINLGGVCPDTIQSILNVVDITPDLKNVPNCFTPNNDGINDEFKIADKNFCKYLGYTILNRWGQEIFYTTNIHEAWDGKQNGYDLPEGAYVVVLHGKKPINLFLTIMR